MTFCIITPYSKSLMTRKEQWKAMNIKVLESFSRGG